jgi:hypothetical protein
MIASVAGKNPVWTEFGEVRADHASFPQRFLQWLPYRDNQKPLFRYDLEVASRGVENVVWVYMRTVFPDGTTEPTNHSFGDPKVGERARIWAWQSLSTPGWVKIEARHNNGPWVRLIQYRVIGEEQLYLYVLAAVFAVGLVVVGALIQNWLGLV